MSEVGVEVERVAEVVAIHQRVTVKPGHPCYCGKWPTGQVGQPGWHEHVAEALADAGLLVDRAAERKRDEWEAAYDSVKTANTAVWVLAERASRKGYGLDAEDVLAALEEDDNG